MMKVTYQKMSARALLTFHKDCFKAAIQCPQYRQNPFDAEDILLGEVSKEAVFSYWSQATVLWNAGYHVELSTGTKILIAQYNVVQAKARLAELEDDE